MIQPWSKATYYLLVEQSLTNDQKRGRMGVLAATVFTFQTCGIVTYSSPIFKDPFPSVATTALP
ncbi:hypothetical protein ARMGADRAFT_1017880 [Armillaria gallica]|uniref:Uncharacterized protein n=1 Tax=Armillaria gallica TaxID=47427 RepID=A0A2H3CWD6_ARMGA|nr:hypothetical protein ARMGADRAFT_1017880 [Armillaria gallica]